MAELPGAVDVTVEPVEHSVLVARVLLESAAPFRAKIGSTSGDHEVTTPIHR